MGIFDLSDFERQGNIEHDIHFTGIEQETDLLIQATSSALKTIQIYTPDLEPLLYHNQKFIDNLLLMARGNRHAQIQILAADSSSAVLNGHLLLRLAQQLTSSIEIRKPLEEYQENNIAFILVDKKAFIYRPDVRYFEGIYNAECKFRAQKLADIFTLAWEHAEIDMETQRLNI